MLRCVLGLGVQVCGLPGRAVRCGNVVAHRVMLYLVPDGGSNRNMLPAAQLCPCLSVGCGVWGMCYGMRLLGFAIWQGCCVPVGGGGSMLSGAFPFLWRFPLSCLLGCFQFLAEYDECGGDSSARLPGDPLESAPSPHLCRVVSLGLFSQGYSLGSCASVGSGVVGVFMLGSVSRSM